MNLADNASIRSDVLVCNRSMLEKMSSWLANRLTWHRHEKPWNGIEDPLEHREGPRGLDALFCNSSILEMIPIYYWPINYHNVAITALKWNWGSLKEIIVRDCDRNCCSHPLEQLMKWARRVTWQECGPDVVESKFLQIGHSSSLLVVPSWFHLLAPSCAVCNNSCLDGNASPVNRISVRSGAVSRLRGGDWPCYLTDNILRLHYGPSLGKRTWHAMHKSRVGGTRNICWGWPLMPSFGRPSIIITQGCVQDSLDTSPHLSRIPKTRHQEKPTRKHSASHVYYLSGTTRNWMISDWHFFFTQEWFHRISILLNWILDDTIRKIIIIQTA